MFEITRAVLNDTTNGARKGDPGNAKGFSLAELLIILAIGTILTIVAIPSINSGVRNYRISGAVSAVTWAIHSTRYQALEEGYPFQVVFSSTANNYLIQSSPANNGTYSNVDTYVPISSWPVTLSADTTLNFKPNGFVSAPVGALSFTMTYQGVCQKLTVTNYGNVSVSPNYPQPTCP
jgi:Tfp pilus assembly protein FimT